MLKQLSQIHSLHELREFMVARPELGLSVHPDAKSGWGIHRQPEAPTEARLVQEFAAQQLQTLQRAERTALISRLIIQASGRGEDLLAHRVLLDTLAREFQLPGIQGFRNERGGMRPEPAWTWGEVLAPSVSYQQMRQATRGEPIPQPDGVLLPLKGHGHATAALWLASPGREWLAEDLELLHGLGQALGHELERVQEHRHLLALLDLQTQILRDEVSNAYQTLLEHAIDLIPGAECGSLLIRDGEFFRYAAIVSFDSTELSDVTFNIHQTRDSWYGLGVENWNRGVPRILRDSRIYVQGRGFNQNGEYHMGALRSVDDIVANVGVPILHLGQVYGFLNFDSLSDAGAFDDHSVAVAQSFATQAAILLYQAEQRAQIKAAALTDTMTGLPNRRAFNDELTAHVANAHRHDTPLALLIADVRDFKRINDTCGHAVGDTALIKVADILRTGLRSGDRVFRWGGDEFAALLPSTNAAEAENVKERVEHAMQGRRVERLPLRLNLGYAVLDAQDITGDQLLRDADTAMYQAKRLDKAND